MVHKGYSMVRLIMLGISVVLGGVASQANAQETPRTKRLPSEQEITSGIVRRIQSLKLIEGEMPKWLKDSDPYTPHHQSYLLAMHPYVVMDKGEYAVMSIDSLKNNAFILAVGVKKLPTESVRGTLFIPDGNYQKMVKLRFEIPPADFDADSLRTTQDKLNEFTNQLYSHYSGAATKMSLYSMSGANWFRMQASARLGRALPSRNRNDDPTSFAYNFLDKRSTFHESLGLDILKERQNEKKPRVDPGDLPEPTVRQIDCKIDVPQAVQFDRLASSIPQDQWAIFCPNIHEAASSFQRFRSECSRFHWTVDEGGVSRSNVTAADLPTFYEKQLAIDASLLLREPPSKLVTSVAMTGSDLAFCMGTDIALLIDSSDVAQLNSLLLAHREKIAKSTGECQRSVGELAGVRYQLIQNQDRSLSSFQAVLDSRIVITNSLEQLKRLTSVLRSEQKAIRSDELYVWLRHRFPLENTRESGLLVVTEPFVRRLASARWRIAAARRWVAAAFQKELQARSLEAHLLDTSFDLEKHTSELGISLNHRLIGDQIQHKVFGSNAFYTPVIEIPVADISEGEAKACTDWLKRNELLTSSLDPMGIQFNDSKTQLLADIAIFPKSQNVNYFGLDIYLGRRYPLQMLKQVLFRNEDAPKVKTWRILFLLNEMRRQFPKQDPAETYKQLTGRRVPSVPGGSYRWNEEWQSMECTVCGCPGSSSLKFDQAKIWEKVEAVHIDESLDKNCNRIRVSVDYAATSDDTK